MQTQTNHEQQQQSSSLILIFTWCLQRKTASICRHCHVIRAASMNSSKSNMSGQMAHSNYINLQENCIGHATKRLESMQYNMKHVFITILVVAFDSYH